MEESTTTQNKKILTSTDWYGAIAIIPTSIFFVAMFFYALNRQLNEQPGYSFTPIEVIQAVDTSQTDNSYFLIKPYFNAPYY